MDSTHLSSESKSTVRMAQVQLLYYCVIRIDEGKQFIDSTTLHRQNIEPSTL